MLNKEDNELITDTERGTPMGELFRRFWIPVALSEELPGPDSIPVRLRIMGEDLIAFRDSEGRVGLLDKYCPHRGASLFFGRNEDSGLRCIYHGWKFDVTGQCIDLPNTPEGESYKEKVRTTAYPVVEAGDVLWAYMGPRDKMPPFPEFEWTKLPRSHRYVTKFRLECNWLQATEGDFDPSHARFLHSTLDNNQSNPGNALNQGAGAGGRVGVNQVNLAAPIDPREPYPRAVGNRRFKEADPTSAANMRLEDIDAAFFSIAASELPDGRKQAVAGLRWHMPMFCPPGVARPGHFSANMRVPVDNHSLMFFRLRWSLKPMTNEDLQEYKLGGYTHPEMVPGTWQTKANVHNDYEMDRLAQKHFSYSGIKTFPLQDIAMMEDQWGPLADRRREHLTSMDYQIIYLRRRLLRTAKALAQGVEPAEPWMPES
ncbi:MAG TPA: Rieske 2Fe-2S domain-containing protein, partial [Dehalococcoidia bacterium]|nr:Rieske 2Fe-2S domain-containing protein [Dehalococcoidia bacterium]